MDALDAAQGKVSNVEAAPVSSTSATISFLAPDTFACSVDWRPAKAAGFKRVPNAAHQRDQKVTLAALPAHALISYRVNCAVQQPSGTLQLP